jgi:hypothetical protein
MASLLDRAEVGLCLGFMDQPLGSFPRYAGCGEVSGELHAQGLVINSDELVVAHCVSPCQRNYRFEFLVSTKNDNKNFTRLE